MRRGHSADVGRDARDALELGVPGPVDRIGGQRERRGGQVQEPVRIGRRELPVLDGDVGQGEQLSGEELAGGQEALQPACEVRVEEASVLRDQHRGEHPERVRRELGTVKGPEGRRDDRYGCRRSVAQVVEPARRHAQGTEHPGHLGQLLGCAHADRAVPLRGDAVDAAQAFGSRALPRDDALVHLLGDLDQGR